MSELTSRIFSLSKSGAVPIENSVSQFTHTSHHSGALPSDRESTAWGRSFPTGAEMVRIWKNGQPSQRHPGLGNPALARGRA